MIDGIKLTGFVDDREAWQNQTGIELYNSMNTQTGEQPKTKSRSRFQPDGRVSYSYWGKLGTYQIQIIETRSNKIKPWSRINIRGSMHKNYDGNNRSRFTFMNVQQEVHWLERKLSIPATDLKIQNIEFGANIDWNQPVYHYLKSALVAYKRSQFNSYHPDKTGRRLGFLWEGSQYLFKIYDKGFTESDKIMRIEVSIKKMQAIENTTSIGSLLDLTDEDKAFPLINKLLTCWNNVVLIDPMLIQRAIPKDQISINKYTNPKYWSTLNDTSPRAFKYQMSILNGLKNQYFDESHGEIKKSILNEWELCFEKTYSRKNFVPKLPGDNKMNLVPFLPLR